MSKSKSAVFIAATALYPCSGNVEGELSALEGVEYYKIHNYDNMPPFFMNIVSSSDHWMYVSSTGGLTAGRVDADNALFPYYTVDKIHENYEFTGPTNIFLIKGQDKIQLWEPFSRLNAYQTERNLYKSIYGDEVIFQEINHDLKLMFRYSWKTSEKYGFVLKSELQNFGDKEVSVQLLSGLRNLQTWGTSADMQRRLSNLLDAYKMNELDVPSSLGILSFSAAVSDLAEPSESLKATTVWQHGLTNGKHLLSSLQINNFRHNEPVIEETRVQGEKGAFLINTSFLLKPKENKRWFIISEVNQDHSKIINLKNSLEKDRACLTDAIERDCLQNTKNLRRIIGSTDGLQLTNDKLSSVHHFANALYNTMRGGTFYKNYQISKSDFLDYLHANRKDSPEAYSGFIGQLPDEVTLSRLLKLAALQDSPDLYRLCRQYLPLFFSRRHGDPSRPWNKFSIQLKNQDGSDKLDYQGNWRDIFQNWEALALSYPEYIENMIFRFLNATTADGYNPYRIHLTGVDWEKPDPEDPWSNIGYWSDHQIIYLQKLMELSLHFHPDSLINLLNKKIFVHSNIPYRIKPYSSILEDPYETINFDSDEDLRITERVETTGSDGQLLFSNEGNIVHISMMEKMLVLLLAKLSNFIPGGGLWMNTQRPEWNDANNALAGKGLSVVTVCYIRRYLSFMLDLLKLDSDDSYSLTAETNSWLSGINSVMQEFSTLTETFFDTTSRKKFMDLAGRSADEYRQNIYRNSFSGKTDEIAKHDLSDFLNLALRHVEHCIRENKREDGLYHSYNILDYKKDRATVNHFYEMLEGQVAVLSSGLLDPEESLKVLTSLQHSMIYRKDQHSYMLYPNRNFPGFLDRNTISKETAEGIGLVKALEKEKNRTLIIRDDNGSYHFNGNFHNVKDVRKTLNLLRNDDRFKLLVDMDNEKIEELFIRTFSHQEFTGRSGAFFGYEGLGSIYWHMVSKLLLAAQETAKKSYLAENNPEITGGLAAAYYDIRNGIGFNKSPGTYGAFPTDPYSHTPADKGAKQPGMTGQVKEEIITRLIEMGLSVEGGKIRFIPFMLRKEEFLEKTAEFKYFDVSGSEKTIMLPADSAVFTFCQVPFIIKLSQEDRILIEKETGPADILTGDSIPEKISSSIFRRNGEVKSVTFEFPIKPTI